MARVQVVIPDADHARFVHQAQSERMTLSAWLRTAAHDRIEAQQRVAPFTSLDDLAVFFRSCDALDGPESEPDWGQHLRVIEASRDPGAPTT